ncbi:MAG: AbrB/MazE/SpoVT family DNA-binding domain-containing protein [Thermomicrobiales bacterium]|nr:AbrB/MazE/SpoVT family DNA-binding domain-containing protein [Thermomicrobiales bacterium]
MVDEPEKGNKMKDIYYATLTSKGQITVPRAVREALAVYTGDRVEFTVEEGLVAVKGISTDIEDLFGKFKPVPGADLTDFDAIRRNAWEEAIGDKYGRVAEE